MSIVNAAGVITQLSVSQVEKADHKQTGGCLRRWWFEAANGLKPEQTYEKNEGTAGHELLRRYFLTGESPKGRTLMGKAVTGAILKGELPTPGPDLIVEKRFSGQDMRDESRCECGHSAGVHDSKGCRHLSNLRGTLDCTCTTFTPAWIPLDTAETLHLAGVPWDGAIDLVYRRGERPVVMDHKFSSDPDLYAKKNSELIKTVQMPLYAHSQIPYWPDAREFELVHHYVSKKGVYSFMRRAVVSVDQIAERVADIVTVVDGMRAVTAAKDQNDVPANTRSCDAWMGCPHQNLCSAFKRRNTNPGARPMALSEFEQNIFDSIPADDLSPPAAPAPAPAPAPVAPAEPEVDEVAALQAKLAEAQAAQEAKTTRRRMLIVDTDPATAISAPIPVPTPAPETAQQVSCKCGEAITPENGSKLRDGAWKHIGCKLDAAPPPPPKPRAKKSDALPVPPVPDAAPTAPGPTPLAPKAFAGERESDRAARAAMESAQSEMKTRQENVKTSDAVRSATLGALNSAPPRNEALARLFDACASLLRAP